MKIRPVGSQLFHADKRTDRHNEANGRFFATLQNRLKVSVSNGLRYLLMNSGSGISQSELLVLTEAHTFKYRPLNPDF
jgi:hypothetical protein